ncbi:hypothetical protein HBH42_095600 [Parastagonospora nodorum]|nr:hypothetical protein HBH42_095600 [Parastagonospora nodorum]
MTHPTPPDRSPLRPSFPTLQHTTVFPTQRLSGSTIAPTPPQPPTNTPLTPITANVATLFPTTLPPRPARTRRNPFAGLATYIFPRPTMPARQTDVEMGEMRVSQSRYVSGGGSSVSAEGRWGKRTKGKIGVAVGIVAVFWVLILVGVFLQMGREKSGQGAGGI